MHEPTTHLLHRVGQVLSVGALMILAFISLMAVDQPAQAQENRGTLDILDESVTSTLDKDEAEFDAKVFVRNASNLEADNVGDAFAFSVVARNKDMEILEEQPTVQIENSTQGPVDPYSVQPVNLKIAYPETKESFSGHLVVSSKQNSAVEPGTVPISVQDPIARAGDIRHLRWFLPFRSYSWMVGSALVFSALVVILSYRLRAAAKRPGLWSPLGATLELDAKSWASILVLVAAILSAIKGAEVFPEVRSLFTTEEISGMSLFFGASLLFGPVVYNLIRRQQKVKPKTPKDEGTSITGTFEGNHGSPQGVGQGQGFNGKVNLMQSAPKAPTTTTKEVVGFVATYLVAATLILMAVVGQLLLAWLYLAQITDVMPWWARVLLAVGVGGTMLFVVIYAVDKIRTDCAERSKEQEEEEAATGQWIRPQSTLKMP